ncbi:MAG: (2Fe-2S) ferredoxin domain-containing protein [Leptolyngbyaceae cyanobacterium]
MAKSKQSFCLEGEFEGFMAGNKSPFKYLSLRNAHEQHAIKLSKSLRLMLFRYLQVGDWVRVVGEQSVDKETGEPKLKAREVVRIDQPTAVPAQTVPAKSKGKKPKILICQKSTCRKRGAAQVCREVEATLADCGLTDAVDIKLTGCMDKCKAGPNVVMMPQKQRYSNVKPKQVPELIAQNFQPNDVG